VEFPIYMYVILLAILASTSVYFQRQRPLYLTIFPVFLVITLIMEGVGIYLWYHRLENLVVYNWFTAFEFCFYLFVLSKIIQKSKAKRITRLVLLLYAAGTIINLLFFQGKGGFHSITYSIGCLLIVAACIYYFLELFRLPRYVNLAKEPPFWICSGLLFYYCCSFPLLGLVNFIGSFPRVIIDNLDFFLTLMNVLLYSLFTIAFLCRIKTRKYIS
jgi:hypothetical protein